MDIALIMHELLVEGGGERQCVSLARALAKQGHQVTLYTCAYDREHCFPDICKGLSIQVVGRGRFPRLGRLKFLRGYLDMKHLAAKVRDQHEIWNPHHWPAQWGAVWLKRKLGGKAVWMCNDVPAFYHLARQPRGSAGFLRAAVYNLLYLYDRMQNKKMDLNVFLSHWAADQFQLIYSGKTAVVRSGADPERFRPGGDRDGIRRRFGCSDADFLLLWLGIFMPHRRLQDAIQAVALLAKDGTRVKLLLAGSDRFSPEYAATLRKQVADLGVERNIIFSGKVADEEIRDFYCAADAFLFPNEHQTWGLAVLEAMACGRPVLVSTGAAVHEILTDNQSAILFPPRNPPALAERITGLMKDPGTRSEIAARGMKLVQGKYNWEQFGLRMSSVFAQTSGGGGLADREFSQELDTER